jgi:cell wall-associated NlpC family hydrolase
MVINTGKVAIFLPLIISMIIFPVGCCSVLDQDRQQKQPVKLTKATRSKPKTVVTLRESIVKVALLQIGKPYVWGGDSPGKGFDCSGLTWWVYRKNGIRIPRVSHQQRLAGRSIAKKDLRHGDLILFKTNPRGKSLHVGIYVGKGKFIHSPKSGAFVRVDSVSNPYWKRVYVCSRRVFT